MYIAMASKSAGNVLMGHSGDSSLVNNTMHKQFHLCSFLGLSCENKKRIHKYLQITECCLWESHSLRTTEATGLSKKKKKEKKKKKNCVKYHYSNYISFARSWHGQRCNGNWQDIRLMKTMLS